MGGKNFSRTTIKVMDAESSENQKDIFLTPKQKEFCDEYLKSNNYTQSAKKVGYLPKTAWALLQKEECKNYINSVTAIFKQDVKNFSVQITIDWKLKKLRRIVDEFIKDEGKLNAKEAKAAISAIAEMNKMQGHYAPEKQISLNIDLKEISDKVETLRLKYKNVF